MKISNKIGREKILLVNYEMSYTGSPRALLNLAFVLRKLSYTIDVWTFNSGPFEKEFADIDIHVRTINFPVDDEKVIGDILRGYKFVIANTIFCATFASFAESYTNTILYIMEAQNLPKLIRDCHINQHDLISVSHILCVSSYACDFIKEHYLINNISVLQNYVKQWKKRRFNYIKRDNIVRFLVSGTIERRKGQDVALEAFLLLPEDLRKKSELHFVGLFPEWSRSYQNEIYSKKDDRIFFHEVIEERDELFGFYNSMDIILVTSRDEACSFVALEAAMLKKALVVTENTGAKYVVSERCIVPTGDSFALSKKMEEYIKEPLIIKLQGLQNYQKYLKFGTQKHYKKIIKKYLKEVSNKEFL